MIGYIIFGFGLGMFVVATSYWVFYMVKSNEANKAGNFREELQMDNKMCLAGVFTAVSALLVNIGNVLIKHIN